MVNYKEITRDTEFYSPDNYDNSIQMNMSVPLVCLRDYSR